MGMYRKIVNGALLLILFSVIALSGTAFASERESVEEAGKGPIVVASKIDTEGGLLGYMIVHMLEANGFETVDKVQFGTTDVLIILPVEKIDPRYFEHFGAPNERQSRVAAGLPVA